MAVKKSYIKIESASHVWFDAYTHPAYTKGDSVIPLDGNPGNWNVDASDYNEVADGPVIFDIGRDGKVYTVAAADVGQASSSPMVPASTVKVYSLIAGGWTTDSAASGVGPLAGVITSVGAASVSFLGA